MGERVVFVRVALGALRGKAEHGFPDRVDAVEDTLDAELLGLRAAFLVGHRVPQETGGDAVVLGGFGQEVACDLFDDEVVVRHVRVHRRDDPVAVEMVDAREIFLVARGVRVARGVQPLPRPALAEAGAGYEAVGLLVVIEGCGKFLRGRRQACQVEGEAAEESGGIRFRRGREFLRLQFGEDKMIDGIFHPCGIFHRRNRRALRGDESPMHAPLRSLLDPLPDQGDLLRLQAFFLVRRRHDLVGIAVQDALKDQGVSRIARHDGLAAVAAFQGEIAVIETEPALDGRLVGAVAGVAVFRKNGLDLRVEIHLSRRSKGG